MAHSGRDAEHRLNLLCGGVAGASNIFTGFPFDTVKVRLQASPQGTYAGPWDCAKTIWRFEGVSYTGLRLYRKLQFVLLTCTAGNMNYCVNIAC